MDAGNRATNDSNQPGRSFNAFTKLRVDHLYTARRASGFVTRTACPSRKASAFSMLWR